MIWSKTNNTKLSFSFVGVVIMSVKRLDSVLRISEVVIKKSFLTIRPIFSYAEEEKIQTTHAFTNWGSKAKIKGLLGPAHASQKKLW
jgi:hypothetical protein